MARKQEQEEERKTEISYTPFWQSRGQCYEAVLVDGKEKFLTFEDEKFKLYDELREGERTIRPDQPTPVKYSFTSGVESLVAPDLPRLYAQVHRYYDDYFAHLDHRIKEFLALYTIHSYILMKSLGVISIWLVGPKRSGKTTAQILFEKLGYRVFGGVAPSEASIYRTLGCVVEYGPGLVMKEFENASDLMKQIFREADIPGTTIDRVDKVDGDRYVTNFYFVYTSRVTASNKLHGGDADLDRFHIITCMHLKPKRPRSELYRKKEVIQDLSGLRNSLLLWKIVNFGRFEVPFEDPRDEITEGRDWEHYGGILTLASMISSDLERELRDLVKQYLAESREDEKSTVIGLLKRIIKANAEPYGETFRIPFHVVWQKLGEECLPFYEGGSLVPTKLVAPDGKVITSTTAGKLLKEQLLGKRNDWREGKIVVRGYEWTKEAFDTVVEGVEGVDGLGAQKRLLEGQNQEQNNPSDGIKTGVKPSTLSTPSTVNTRSEDVILAVGGAFWEVFGSLEGPNHEAVAKDTLTKVLIEKFRISQEHAEGLVRSAFKEGKLCEPRPGYYRKVLPDRKEEKKE